MVTYLLWQLELEKNTCLGAARGLPRGAAAQMKVVSKKRKQMQS